MRDDTDKPNVQTTYPELQDGMQVHSADDQPIGRVLEVFRDIGEIESFGAKGLRPEQEGFDAQNYDYSTAQPGSGDNYFVARDQQGEILYIAFSYIDRVENGKVYVAAETGNIPDMNWQVRPDALKSIAHEYDVDTGAEPHVA
jgi:hypothetical protein